MSTPEITKLEAQVKVLLLIQAQTLAIAATAKAGPGNELSIIQAARKSVRQAATGLPENLRTHAQDTVSAFFDLLEKGAKT